MKSFSKNCLPFLALLCCVNAAFAQYSTYTVEDPLKAVVNMDQYDDPYAFNIKYAEAPHPAGKAKLKAYLRAQKLEAQKRTPATQLPGITSRGAIPAPDLLSSFSGNNIITGTPLDNHFAIGLEEQPVSAINTHMLVTNNTGFWLGSYKLDEFFQNVGTNTHFFDPRLIYDPEQNRFILVLINASECEDSQIVIAFSQTSNPKGSWNLYALDGCIDDDGTFADYPMIALTDQELFLTYNEVHSDSSWQTGFMGTQIHQINKQSGYDGETLSRRVWRDIRFNGRLLRNICPVRNADEQLPTSMHLVSTRNFDITNDTVFLLHLTGRQDDPNATLNIDYRVMNQPYGVPPYAKQPKDSMDTNDGRILDAFLLNDEIQFVSNSMDFSTGRSGVYHGFINSIPGSTDGTAHIIGHPTDYLGYPGLAWTGSTPAERDAIIVMSHCSAARFPGGSAIYSDGNGQYSEFTTVIEGTRSVDMLTGPVERWGDYVGIQRLYHQPGSVWVSMSYGRQGNVNEAWIAKLARHDEMTATDDLDANANITAYPNPSDDYINVDIDNPDGKNMQAALYDMNGQVVKDFYNGIPNYPGKASLNFSVHTLPAGTYILKVIIGQQEVASKQIIKM
jgi:hypothetical protein